MSGKRVNIVEQQKKEDVNDDEHRAKDMNISNNNGPDTHVGNYNKNLITSASTVEGASSPASSGETRV